MRICKNHEKPSKICQGTWEILFSIRTDNSWSFLRNQGKQRIIENSRKVWYSKYRWKALRDFRSLWNITRKSKIVSQSEKRSEKSYEKRNSIKKYFFLPYRRGPCLVKTDWMTLIRLASYCKFIKFFFILVSAIFNL